MDYTTRTIYNDDGTYRMLGRVFDEEGIITVEGTRIDTDYNGDVWIEVPKEVFFADVPGDMKTVIETFYPSIGEIHTLDDIFTDGFKKQLDNTVVFKTGIYGRVNGGISRDKKTSDFEFSQFIALANDDYSNIWVRNPYAETDI